MHLALTGGVAAEIRRGRLPGAVPEDAQIAGGMVALAMGKMGAGELNYSSDIDLICLFDETHYPGQEQEARASFIKVTRRMTAILSDATDGYVFRSDLRLRPRCQRDSGLPVDGGGRGVLRSRRPDLGACRLYQSAAQRWRSRWQATAF